MRSIFLLLFFAWFFLPGVPGESAVGVSGVVRDESGAALAQARIVVLDESTQAEIHALAVDNQGRFTLELEPGRYVVSASAEHFATVTKVIQVPTQIVGSVDFTLPIAGLVEQVSVTERAVTALRSVPGSVAYVEQQTIEDSLAVNLKDALSFTPGVLVQPRFGADESQISIRGSGLQNNFHLRGLNVFINRIPYQDADGFGDFESIDLMASTGVEVWKGANALRYGANSLGGAINVITHTGETASPLSVWLQGGSFGHFKGQISSGGTQGNLRYYASFSDTELDGYREHSEQDRKRVFSNLGWTLDAKTDLHVDFMYANVSEKLPGALGKEDFLSDPKQANPVNVVQDWARYYDYFRVGGSLTRDLGNAGRMTFTAHGQHRDMVHPIFQVLDNVAVNYGLELTYVHDGDLGGRRNELVVGFSPQWGTVDEQRFENVAGQSGDLVADFETYARNVGVFFEDQFYLDDDLRLVLGGRADWARREFTDLVPSDGDRSDEKTYDAFVPKFGFIWDRSPEIQVYGNASRSHEPPLLLELTSFGAPGFLDLKAASAWQFEIGSRGTHGEHLSWDVAFYDAEIQDELLNVNLQPFPGAPFTIPSYRNIDQSRHTGLELGSSLSYADVAGDGSLLSWRTAYTWSRFRFVDDPVYSDNELPGAPHHLVRTELRYDHRSGLWVAPNLDWSPTSYFVDSANTVTNDAYAVLNLKIGYDSQKFDVFFQAANLTGRNYSGSAQVDSDIGEFFEPSNGRSAFVGLRWKM